ncbi:MAG: hypothetical protein AB7O59_06190 [Pirellulales bacterium]
MALFTRTLLDPFGADRPALARARYGMIEMRDGRLAAIHARPWPKVISAWEVEWRGERRHRSTPGDRCLIYYNQPRRHANFLALPYVVSQRDCTLATFHRGLEVLDAVAQLKHVDAIVCDAWNLRISDRLLARWGWQSHKPQRWHRNFIKRFYGVYPAQRGELLHGCPAASASAAVLA